ncbi:heptaprenyl diphosphate synthase [Pseudoclavibacter chungangensis]|nr:polyprenyl synthetase family protein [Pseudoclavibacter chungangensis]NYJ67883.1 heptaprenyl diphosphate synthase [Pseudoclavibacter chungangensis]
MKQPSTEQRRPSRGIVRSGVAGSLFQGPDETELRESIEHGLERVEELLHREVHFADEVADVVTSHLMIAGGKRMRPMLTLLTSHTGPNPVSDDAITAAAAVEITHLASLYHDDVMDEADLRRGVTAAHLNWGNSIAILAGDLLFARSSLIFTELGPVYIRLQSRTFERLVLGQMRETVGPREGEDRVEHYVQVLADKTGSLIAAAAQFGGMASGADDEVVAALAAYGEAIGVAFQIADDVIDLSADREATGKVAGTDLRAGVETLPVLLLERRADEDPAAAELLERIRTRVAGADAEDPQVAAIVAELRAHDVTRATTDEASAWVDRAIAALAPLPDGAVTDALIRFAGDVVARDR